MTKRSVVAVLLLSVFTLGIYCIVWCIKTKHEFAKCGYTDVPSGWLLVIGIPVIPLGIWWLWKWGGGVDHVTHGKMERVVAFILLFLLFWFGVPIIQHELNVAIDRGTPNALPKARVA